MQFRYARHTNNLVTLVDFYQNIIGLEKLGGFTDHKGYDGVFLGFAHQDWHFEFTQSPDKADHYPDKDDLIVFYLDSEEQIQTILRKAEQVGVLPVTSQNPYWNEQGTELTDPDGFGVMLSMRRFD